ncbi:HNH endonuclease [Rhodomicrobium sp. Az07]|uniref:HNH endonuclease n=1 Tax=Rhodomicrobium sp. Az07 TaxID=2839034 RepID=UPI001BE739E9|nr:HNH endonuclease [Rhodomicrobium sp. Az07]MBT3070018.1 HNH endonuclease [Rhodomicrobium sp. Az07]
MAGGCSPSCSATAFAAALGALLQSHAGVHFAFALVELATWKSGTGDILVVPGILAKTLIIERGVVRIEGSAATIHPVPTPVKGPQSISSADFWENIPARDPALVPESLGNRQHVLPKGIVCDGCNNYFSRKVENRFWICQPFDSCVSSRTLKASAAISHR